MLDALLIVAYTVTLVAGCRLGSRLARRRTTHRIGVRLGVLVLAAAVLDALGNVALWGIVRNPGAVSSWLAGTVAAMAMTKFVIIGLATAYTLGAIVGGVAAARGRGASRFGRRSGTAPGESSTGDSDMVVSSRRAEHNKDFMPPSSNLEPSALDGDASPSAAPDAAEAQQNVVGVGLSGGGVRAASFALGAIQGFTSFERVRYMATVSGGGYIAMARQILLHHDGVVTPAPLAADQPETTWITRNARYLWPPARPSRESLPPGYGAPLTTGASFKKFAASVGVLLAAIIGNALLLIALLFVISRPVGWMTRLWPFDVTTPAGLARPRRWWHVEASALESAVVVVAFWPILGAWWQKTSTHVSKQVALAVVTILAAAGCGWMMLVDSSSVTGSGHWYSRSLGTYFVIAGVVYAGVYAAVTSLKSARAGFGIALVALGLAKFWVDTAFRAGPGKRVNIHLDSTARIVIELALILAALAAARFLVSPGSRKASVGAWWTLVLLAAAFTGGMVLIAAQRFDAAMTVAVCVPGAATILLSVIFATKKMPSANEAFVGSRVNMARLIVGLTWSLGVASLCAAVLWSTPVDRRMEHLRVMTLDGSRWLALAIAIALIAVWADQSWWSPHRFYRRRLAHTFSPFRGGRVPDDPETTDLPEWAHRVGTQPELLICAAAYDTANIAPRYTQAVPFVFSASAVGTDPTTSVDAARYMQALGPHEAETSLHGAVAIAGAAVSPALGAVRMASLSQVFAFFNLRLGVWLPNPKHVRSFTEHHGVLFDERGVRWNPRRRLGYLLKELANLYDLESRFVYVTDGGQFDNLGLFELLRRRCTTIYIFDASGDGGTVNTLLHTMSLCHRRLGIDFGDAHGVKVTLPTTDDSATWEKTWHDELGLTKLTTPHELMDGPFEHLTGVVDRSTIELAAFFPGAGPQDLPARICFAKARLSDQALEDPAVGTLVGVYAHSDAKFPENSTADQFMDDAQFAAYVELGRWSAQTLLSQRPI
ncbi:MAG: hypothetical protein JWL72_3857 [Ilumatobacteraceae bacterium]|nr:hypothetical protein [Ilumatobacteraceae bacterium]